MYGQNADFLNKNLVIHSVTTGLWKDGKGDIVNSELTPWSRVIPEKLPGSQLVEKFYAFYGTRTFVIAFTRARHLSPFGRSFRRICPNPRLLWPFCNVAKVLRWVVSITPNHQAEDYLLSAVRDRLFNVYSYPSSPPSATRGRPVPRWQSASYHGLEFVYKVVQIWTGQNVKQTVPVIFEPPCICGMFNDVFRGLRHA
jgi:hypothetical protein